MSSRKTLIVLTIVFAVNQMDRHIFSISLEALGTEFDLSDTHLGFLSGAFFAIIYAVFGIPVAKMAAKGNRRNIIASAVAIWSTLTIAMIAVQNYSQLLVARLGVSIGEAGAVSPAHSIISDLYPAQKRVSAMATFASGANLGILLAFLIGGLGGQWFGWRWAFVIAGVPGLFLAIYIRTQIKEPKRETSAPKPKHQRSLLLTTIKVIWADRGLRHTMFGLGLLGIATFGGLTWVPTFTIRVLGLSLAEMGLILSLMIGILGGFGTWYSGRLTDKLANNNPKWNLGIIICSILIVKPFLLMFFTQESAFIAMLNFGVVVLFAGVYWAPTFAFVHGRVDSEMRPMVTAIYLFVYNLIGAGIGPTLVGITSDTIFCRFWGALTWRRAYHHPVFWHLGRMALLASHENHPP